MSFPKLFISAIIALLVAVIPITAATSELSPRAFFYGSGDTDTRLEFLDNTNFFWGNNAEIVREPSPELLSWYKRERKVYRNWVSGEKEISYERIRSFLTSKEHAHINLFYSLQRIDDVLKNIQIALDKDKPETELFSWISLSAEVINCGELVDYSQMLKISGEISSENHESISEFCMTTPKNLHRNIIMPLYYNLHVDEMK